MIKKNATLTHLINQLNELEMTRSEKKELIKNNFIFIRGFTIYAGGSLLTDTEYAVKKGLKGRDAINKAQKEIYGNCPEYLHAISPSNL